MSTLLHESPVVNPATVAPLAMLAVGKFEPGERETIARSAYQSRDIVEHRVARVDADRVVAEVRLNGQMAGRTIFRGYYAEDDAQTWCRTLAPQADKLAAVWGRNVQVANDDAWRAAIEDEIDSLPVEAPDFVSPDFLGAFDAEEDLPCEPLKYYLKLSDIERYIIAWKETRRAIEEAEDHAAQREDVDFFRHGC